MCGVGWGSGGKGEGGAYAYVEPGGEVFGGYFEGRCWGGGVRECGFLLGEFWKGDMTEHVARG